MSLAQENPAFLAPFGWYPDPAGSALLRWWDGSQWTENLESPRPEVQPAAGYASASRRQVLVVR
jgi:hypothetical protein